MNLDKTIELQEIDPISIYGVNNRNLERLEGYFPKLKVIARGNELRLHGNASDIQRFEQALQSLIALRRRKSHLTPADVEQLFEEKEFRSEENNTDPYTIVYGNEGRIITARTPSQKKLVDLYAKNDLLFAIGPAGSGKTYTAIALAVKALKNREVKKLILTRPAVEAGERLGFLPGDMKEKLDPYLQPLYDALHDMIHPKKLQALMEEGIIQIAPLAYMRGRTLDSAFVILDEAQNTSLSQLKMFLTRMGCHAKFIVTGDATQIDLPNKQDSGLLRGIELVRNIPGVGVVEFTTGDIVRHPLVSKIVKAFDQLPTATRTTAAKASSSKAATKTSEASSEASTTMV
ncbi:MAG: PhoH family protein [Bacteroidales bacterium]|nr:PhoH family protein [Bacteroidales bacterium]